MDLTLKVGEIYNLKGEKVEYLGKDGNKFKFYCRDIEAIQSFTAKEIEDINPWSE